MMITAVSAGAMMTTATMRDVHHTNTDHIADARLRTLAHDRLNVGEKTIGAMTDGTTTDTLLANTSPVVAAFHALQTRAADESHIPVRDAQIHAHHRASTGTETADVVHLLLCGQRPNEPLPRPDVVHHQATSLTVIVALDLRGTIGTTVRPDLTGMTTAP